MSEFDAGHEAESPPSVEVTALSFTDVGKVRSLNEDNLLASFPFYLVADGMGGHEHGEVASSMMVELLPSLIGATPLSVPVLRDAIQEGNKRIHLDAGAGRGMGLGMGTTVTGVVVAADRGRPCLLLVNVGDSRTYRMRGGVFEQMSIDHSRVQELYQVGAISADEMGTHPERNVITRAVGIEQTLTPDVSMLYPLAGDRFLVCSDGLSGELSDETLAECLLEPEPSLALTSLRTAVLSTAARDNVTAIVLDISSVPASTRVGDDRTDPRPRADPPHADDTQPRSVARETHILDLIDDVPAATPTVVSNDLTDSAHVIIGEIPRLEGQGGTS